MVQIVKTKKKEGEVFSLCGKKHEEEKLKQYHPLPVNHDEFHSEQMENTKYPSESEGEKKKCRLNRNLLLRIGEK